MKITPKALKNIGIVVSALVFNGGIFAGVVHENNRQNRYLKELEKGKNNFGSSNSKRKP